MGFSEQLKKARVSMGYTQQQVADALGLTASTYCGYETGKRQPDVAKLKQLARILNTTGSFLLETEPVQNTCRPDPGSGNDLMVSYGRLNERSKKQWMIWWPCCWICRKRAKNNKEINL